MIFVDDQPVAFSEYPNGETVVPLLNDIVIDSRPTVRLVWESDVDLARLMLIRGMLEQRGARRPRLFIDYMPYSRMDRLQNDHCFSLKYVGQFISGLKWDAIQVVEPHSDVTLRYLVDQRIETAEPVWATAKLLPKVMERIDFARDTDYIVLPDKGAYERYSELAKDVLDTCNVIVLEKVRDFETGKIRGLAVDSRVVRGSSNEPRGEVGLIIDDLSSRGGTFIQAADLLRETGLCSTVNLLVTHMEPVGYTGDLSKKLDRVFCTDTMPVPALIPRNFHVFERADWL